MDDERRLSQDRIKFLHPRFPQRGKGGIEKAEEFEKKFFITLTLTLGVPMTYTSDEVMLATLFPDAKGRGINTQDFHKLFAKYGGDRVMTKSLFRIFAQLLADGHELTKLNFDGTGKSLSKAVDKMNVHLILNIVQFIHNRDTDTTPTPEETSGLDVMKSVIKLLQTNIDDPTNNEEHNGKKLFAFGVPFSIQTHTFDEQMHRPDCKFSPMERQKVADSIRPFFNQTQTKSPTTITKRSTNMSGFNVNEATDQVIALAYEESLDDIDAGVESAEKVVAKSVNDGLLDKYATDKGLTASERVSLKASVELVLQSLSEDDLKQIHTRIKPSPSTAEATSATPATPAEPIQIVDATMKPALDSMLATMTGGKASDVQKLLSDSSLVAELQTKSKQLEADIQALKTRSTLAPVNLTGTTEVDETKLSYKVVMAKASDIFKNPRSGRIIKQLNFEIPTLVWTDDKGNEVRHPMCPEPNDNYQFRATHLIKFLTAFVLGKNVWCHGHTGTGKTTLPEQIASRIGFPLFPLNLDSQLERADLTGQTNLIQENGATITKFEEGILPRAMIQPCFLVLDEMDAGKPDILFAIQRATEGKGLLLTEDGGRLVKPHPLFRFVATANSRGQGDEYGVYAGVRPMNGALLNRFPMFIEVDYMSGEEEGAMLTKMYSLPNDVCANLVEFAKLCRKAFKSGETSVPVSPRDTMAVAEFFCHYSTILTTKTQAIEFAIDNAILSRCPIDNKQRLVELASRCFADCKFN